MAKPATRMKSVVLKSFPTRTQRLVGSPPSSPHPAKKRKECATLSVCCEHIPAVTAQTSCSPALRDDLRATIEDMVIPRLVVGQCLPQSAAPYRRGRVLPTHAEVDLLAFIAVQPDLDRALELAFSMLRAGLSLDTVLLHLIGAAARRLGTDWEEDQRSFAEVTLGLSTLHKLVHMVARCDTGDEIVTGVTSQHPIGTEVSRRALLVSGQGEQHTLGLYIFAELLRHSHWAVELETNMPERAVLQAVRTQSIDMVGIAISSAARFSNTRDLIHSLHRVSRNQGVHVVIGGPVDLTSEAESEGALYCNDARRAIDWLDNE